MRARLGQENLARRLLLQPFHLLEGTENTMETQPDHDSPLTASGWCRCTAASTTPHSGALGVSKTVLITYLEHKRRTAREHHQGITRRKARAAMVHTQTEDAGI